MGTEKVHKYQRVKRQRFPLPKTHGPYVFWQNLNHSQLLQDGPRRQGFHSVSN